MKKLTNNNESVMPEIIAIIQTIGHVRALRIKSPYTDKKTVTSF